MQAQKYILIKSSYTLEDAEHTTYGIALADGSDLIQSVSDLSVTSRGSSALLSYVHSLTYPLSISPTS